MPEGGREDRRRRHKDEPEPPAEAGRSQDLVSGAALPAEPAQEPELLPEVKVFKGQRVSVFRIDGKDYPSDDPALSPQMRQLFAYLDAHGVTPGLLDCLRQLGRKAGPPPAPTGCPSDGDLAFLKTVPTDPVSGPSAEEDGDPERYGRLRRALAKDGKRCFPVAAAIGLYIVARLLFHSQIRVVDEVITTVLARLLLPF